MEDAPDRANERLRVLTYSAPGMVLPHSLDDLRAALCQLGHTVFVQDLLRLGERWGDGHSLDVAIVDGVISLEPDLIITIDSVGLIPEYLAAMRRRPRCVSWFYDDPIQNFRAKGLAFPLIAPDYHVFCWDRAYLPQLRELGLAHCYHQPFATNTDVHYPRASGEYRYEVSFVGHCTIQRAEVIRALARAGIGVDVFGDPAWGEVVHPNIRFHGHATNREDAPEIYSRSKINLNITNAQLLTSLPVRVFDVLACGGFLLTDHRQDLDQLFRAGADLAVYRGTSELIERVHHYLERPEERERIAARGCQRVLERFTFPRQVASILERVQGSGEPGTAAAIPPDLALLGLFLTGLSYLKFGRYQDARHQLLSAHRIRPDEPIVLLALAVLASQARLLPELDGWLERLEQTGDPLARLAPELRGATRRGQELGCWQALYAGLKGVDPRPDGTIEGWEPRRVQGAEPPARDAGGAVPYSWSSGGRP